MAVRSVTSTILFRPSNRWTKIEHRLFCFITKKWRGRPLTSHQAIVELISNTTTSTGLIVRAALDENEYETAIKISDEELSQIRLERSEFHGVWDPDPQSGLQLRPRPGVHNSGWVQSPGRTILADPQKQDQLKPYVTDLVTHFGNDKRIVMWDLFNEPDNPNTNS